MALRCLRELGIFESVGDGCEDEVDGGLDLVFLGFDFEFDVADFYFYLDWWFLRVFCQVAHLLLIVLCKMYMHNT